MPVLVSEVLLCEKKKNSTNKMLPPVSTEPLDLIPGPPISFLD